MAAKWQQRRCDVSDFAEGGDLYESVYEEAAALRRLVALADAMFVEMRDVQQAHHDAEHFLHFGCNGPSLAGALDGADRSYVYHRCQEGRKLGLPDAMTALGRRPDEERERRRNDKRDRYLTHLRWLAKEGHLAEGALTEGDLCGWVNEEPHGGWCSGLSGHDGPHLLHPYSEDALRAARSGSSPEEGTDG